MNEMFAFEKIVRILYIITIIILIIFLIYLIYLLLVDRTQGYDPNLYVIPSNLGLPSVMYY